MDREKILKEITENRNKFRVDHFDIVISEYIRKNEQDELTLDPPYQRTFRWTKKDQSLLIESILLGIPLPPIYVFQREDGVWEVIDGLQRTMTIISFFRGDLKLEGLKILKELNGYSKTDLPKDIMLRISIGRLRIELIEETKDIFSQYILFDRLNSNGEKLSEQEKRNFLIYKQNGRFYAKIQELGNKEYFLNVLGWKNKKNEEKDMRIKRQENIEYVLKFFLARNTSTKEEIKKYETIEEFINIEILEILKQPDEKLEIEYDAFEKTFKFLNDKLSNNSLKKNGKSANNISNRFTLTTGLSFVINNIEQFPLECIIKKINNFFNSDEYIKLTKNGYSPTKRIYELNRYSYLFFTKELGEKNA